MTAPVASRWAPETEPEEGTNVSTLLREIQERSRALDRASNELFRATRAFEGGYSEQVDRETGEVTHQYVEGPALLFEVAVTESLEDIATEYEDADKKVPAAERLRKKAELRVRTAKPDLWAEYHALKTQMDALTKWISARKQTLNSRQSVLAAERELVNG